MYRDQELIKKMIGLFKKETKESQTEIIKDLKVAYREAIFEQKCINYFTAPEEVERRNQLVHYYKDFLNEIKKLDFNVGE